MAFFKKRLHNLNTIFICLEIVNSLVCSIPTDQVGICNKEDVIFVKIENGSTIHYPIFNFPIFSRFAYGLFYKILANLSNINIPLDSGDFCLITKEALEKLNKLPEENRFIRGCELSKFWYIFSWFKILNL